MHFQFLMTDSAHVHPKIAVIMLKSQPAMWKAVRTLWQGKSPLLTAVTCQKSHWHLSRLFTARRQRQTEIKIHLPALSEDGQRSVRLMSLQVAQKRQERSSGVGQLGPMNLLRKGDGASLWKRQNSSAKHRGTVLFQTKDPHLPAVFFLKCR